MEQADQNNGPNVDAPDPFQPPSGMAEEVEDDIALAEEMGDYPPLATPNNYLLLTFYEAGTACADRKRTSTTVKVKRELR